MAPITGDLDAELDSAPDLELGGPKRRTPKKRVPKPAKDIDAHPPDKDQDTTPDPSEPEKDSQEFTVLKGATTLMDVMATVHTSRGNECCAGTYRKQRMPVAMALNELAKDSPMLQSWITHGKAFKVIALIVALEPIGEHQWLDHLRPAIQERASARREAYDEQEFMDPATLEFTDEQDSVTPGFTEPDAPREDFRTTEIGS